MNKQHTEDRSLVQVRQWKEQIYKETKDLTHQEYLDRLKVTVERIKAQYGLTLKKRSLVIGD